MSVYRILENHHGFQPQSSEDGIEWSPLTTFTSLNTARIVLEDKGVYKKMLQSDYPNYHSVEYLT